VIVLYEGQNFNFANYDMTHVVPTRNLGKEGFIIEAIKDVDIKYEIGYFDSKEKADKVNMIIFNAWGGKKDKLNLDAYIKKLETQK